MTLNRFPTLDEVRAANRSTGLPESYWWIRGGDLNRPVIACLSIGVHINEGAYVLAWFGENVPPGGIKVKDLPGEYELEGPIPPPSWIKPFVQ